MYNMATTKHCVPDEPFTINEAIKSIEHKEWIQAMQEEYDFLIDNGTWILQNLPKGRKMVHSKWVYKIKLATDENVVHLKAWFVAKGFT